MSEVTELQRSILEQLHKLAHLAGAPAGTDVVKWLADRLAEENRKWFAREQAHGGR